MADYTTIDDPSAYFQVLTYTGNGSNPRNLTNTGNSDLKPDFIWVKNRTDASTNHITCNSSLGFDAPKGQGYAWENGPFGGQMSIDSSAAMSTPAATYGYVSAHLTDGFTVAAGGTNGDNCNANNKEFVAYQWKCNGGTKANNTDGNITASVQVNSTAGFSIGMYEGDGSGSATIGHGLGAIPDLFIVKGRSSNGGAAQYWVIGAPNVLGNGTSKHLFFDGDQAEMNNTTVWRNESFTSSIVPMGAHAAINYDGGDYIFYAFKNVQGFSKFGGYTGNGNADGAFIYTGFKPALVIIKVTSNAGYNWWLTDTQRNPQNEMDKWLFPDITNAEYNGAGASKDIDFLSNGFKLRASDDGYNGTGKTYLYFAWAENPFVTSTDTNSIPATAR